MKKSLREQLLERFQLKPGVAIPGGSIERWVLENTDYTASNARRRLREMVEDQQLTQEERIVNSKNHAFYTYQGAKKQKQVVEIVGDTAVVSYVDV